MGSANFGVIRRELMGIGLSKAAIDNLEQILTTAKTADTTSSGHTTDITTLQAEVATLETDVAGAVNDADLALALAAVPPRFSLDPHTFNWTGDATGSLTYDGTGDVSAALTVLQAAKLTTARTFTYTGDATGGPTSFDGSGNVSTALTLAASGVSAGTYGDATHTLTATVDAKGRVTALSTNAIASGGVSSVGISSTTLTVSGGPITTSGTLVVNLSAIADQRLLANVSGGSAAPTATAFASITGIGSALKWTTARTLSFTGDATGSGSVDGSANVSIGLTLSGEAVQDIVGGFVVAGSGMTITYDDAGNTLTFASTGAGGGGGSGVDFFNHSFLGGL